jgi:putative addiction module antidote
VLATVNQKISPLGSPRVSQVQWDLVLALDAAIAIFENPCYNICMNKPLKLIKIGNSTGVILPKEVLDRMKLLPGDDVFLNEAPDGQYKISPYDEDFAKKMELAEAIMREDRDILRVLAK